MSHRCECCFFWLDVCRWSRLKAPATARWAGQAQERWLRRRSLAARSALASRRDINSWWSWHCLPETESAGSSPEILRGSELLQTEAVLTSPGSSLSTQDRWMCGSRAPASHSPSTSPCHRWHRHPRRWGLSGLWLCFRSTSIAYLLRLWEGRRFVSINSISN
jgi:hypothetical protein